MLPQRTFVTHDAKSRVHAASADQRSGTEQVCMSSRITKMWIKARYSIITLLLFLLCNPSYADTQYNVSMNAQDFLVNFAKSVPNLMRMVTAIAYVLGMYFIIAGVMKLKVLGESRTMMSGEHSIKGPLIFLVVGALLLYVPTSVQVGLSTFWTNPNPYSYLQQKDQWAEFLNNVYLIVQLVGVIAFIRGLVILSHLGGHGQPGTFGKGLTHIIGGLFCINIYTFIQVILITLGIQVQ